jgi:parvulin-like peptidyl-prolyl isomerase
LLLSIVLIFTIQSCKEEQQSFTLNKNDHAFELAVLLSEKLPQVDPMLNKVIIKTNYFDVNSNEVIHHLRNIYGKNAADLRNLSLTRLKQEIEKMAHDLALEKLLLIESQKNDIMFKTEDVDSTLALHYSRAGSREAFIKELNNLEIDFDYVKKDIIDGIIINNLVEQVVYSNLKSPADDELKKLYHESDKNLISLRSLVLSTQDKSDQEIEEIKKRINKIYKEALNGVPFEKLVKKYSDDESSKSNGGLYEDLQKGMLESDIAKVVFSTEPGEISQIFETADGLHLIKIESKRTLSFDEFKSRELESIYLTNKNRAYQEYINDLKKSVGFMFIGL